MAQLSKSLATDSPGPGSALGRYELVCVLAAGGLTEVQLARARSATGFQKLVLIKRVLPALARDAGFVAGFLDEARLAATLRHPNIAHVYDVGEEDGAPFFAVEYVHGESLREIHQVGAAAGIEMPLDAALSILVDILQGLDHAHDKRGPHGEPLHIVHSDVSPSNVVVSFEGIAKLTDFAIARAGGGRHTHSVDGSISYMSPEQCVGKKEIDRRTDLFSVGVLLYELTTGTRLFKGQSDDAIARKICDEPLPPPSSRCADYPPGLEAIVVKALARSRADRHASADEMRAALVNWAQAAGMELGPTSLARHMRMLFRERLAAWQSAQTAGASLEDAVVDAAVAAAQESAPPPDDVTRPGIVVSDRPRARRSVWPALAVCGLIAAAAGVYFGLELDPLSAEEPTPTEREPAPRASAAELAPAVAPLAPSASAAADAPVTAQPAPVAAQPAPVAAQPAPAVAAPATRTTEPAAKPAPAPTPARARRAGKQAAASKRRARKRRASKRRRSSRWDVDSPLLPQ